MFLSTSMNACSKFFYLLKYFCRIVVAYLPELGTDLIAALPALDVEDFSHGAVVILIATEDGKESLANALECKAPYDQDQAVFWSVGANWQSRASPGGRLRRKLVTAAGGQFRFQVGNCKLY